MKPFNNSHWTFRWSPDSNAKVNIRYAVHQSVEQASTLIYFLNGRSEWIEKYHEVVEDFRLPKSFGFVLMDHRGQGASEGQRGHIESYETFAEDLTRIINETSAGRPYSVVAHSMGALIALYAAVNQKIFPQKLVLCSPLLALPDKPLPSHWAKKIATTLVGLGLKTKHAFGGDFERPPFEANPLTHDAERYAQMQNNPYPIPAPTFQWVAATFAAIETVFDVKKLASLASPVLLLAGGDERVVQPLGFSQWAQTAIKAGLVDTSFRKIPEARHELLAEIPYYRDKALDAISTFLSS